MPPFPTMPTEREEYFRTIRRQLVPWETYAVSLDPDDPADVTAMTGAEMIRHAELLLAVVAAKRSGDEEQAVRAEQRLGLFWAEFNRDEARRLRDHPADN